MNDEANIGVPEQKRIVNLEYISTKLAGGEFQNVHGRTDEFIEVKTGSVFRYNRQTKELVKIADGGFRTADAVKPKAQAPFIVDDAAIADFAGRMGMDRSLARMYFLNIDGQLYIKVPGLLALATKTRPPQAIAFVAEDTRESNGTWYAHARIYPRVDKQTLEIVHDLAKTQPDMAKEIWQYVTMPTDGLGRASPDTVKMSTIHKFLPEMAQTRAVARALRLYTGYGFTAAEEMQEGAPDATVSGYAYVPRDEHQSSPLAAEADSRQSDKKESQGQKQTAVV
jgi:hypothetical protein